MCINRLNSLGEFDLFSLTLYFLEASTVAAFGILIYNLSNFNMTSAELIPLVPPKRSNNIPIPIQTAEEKELISLLANIFVSSIFSNEKSHRLLPNQYKRAV